MNMQKINDALSIAQQISVADVATLAEQGFKSIVCNRPDGESADQPTFAAIAAAAEDHGLQIVHQPVVGSSITPQDGAEFGQHVKALPQPVLAYCRSGARCMMLHQLSTEE